MRDIEYLRHAMLLHFNIVGPHSSAMSTVAVALVDMLGGDIQSDDLKPAYMHIVKYVYQHLQTNFMEKWGYVDEEPIDDMSYDDIISRIAGVMMLMTRDLGSDPIELKDPDGKAITPYEYQKR